jgi:tetratricopeptide (TPR) repeat protein
MSRYLVLLGLTALLSACAGRPLPLPDPAQLVHLPPRVLLDEVPFHAQDEFQCGPAALAMTLQHRGLTDTPDSLVDRVYIPERKGSLQVEMVSAARERDLLVYPLARNLESILTEVAAGNPVLVMQNLAFGFAPQWHYAVVVGYDLPGNRLLVHSGLNRAQEEPFSLFMRTWDRADRWARVMLPPDRLPASAEPMPFLRAASDLEQTGRLTAASAAYRAALQRWPEQSAARLGLGNIAWAQNRPEDAERELRELVERSPQLQAGWNNLAVVLRHMGCAQAADAALECKQRQTEADGMESFTCPVPTCP